MTVPFDPSKMLPRIHIGSVDDREVDLNDPAVANDGEPDSDDEDDERPASPWLKAVLGFDPDAD